MQRLEDEAYRIKRHGGLALIMIDVDYFKNSMIAMDIWQGMQPLKL